MLKGLLLALAAYGFYATSDAFIKYSGGGASVFTIGFFVTLFSLIPWILSRSGEERWSDVVVWNRPWLVHMRGLSALLSSMFSIYAFTHLPLAEAYALIFLIPLSVTVFSVLLLREPVGWRRWLAVCIGLVGVLLVVRPGFREITLAHGAGIGVAIFGGLNVVLMRMLGPTEKRMALMGILYLYLLAAYLLLMLTAPSMPGGWLLAALIGAGLCSGIGHVLILQATRLAEANQIGPAQYSQIGWAVFYGALFFSEFPDLLTYAGLGIVAASGMFTLVRERARGVRRPFWALLRPRQ